jgi:hypothetical protein
MTTALWLFSEMIGYSGAILIGYSILAIFTEPWPPVEKIASFASALLTILGTLVTAVSIYLPPSLRPPWRFSRRIVAPLVIVASVSAVGFLVWRRGLPPVLVNGFALLAISGGLKRFIPEDAWSLFVQGRN